MFDLSVRRRFRTSSCRIAERRRLRGGGTCLYSTRLLRARCPPLLDREDAAHDHPPPSDSLTTDYYQELGLDQDAPVSKIQDRLTVLEAQNRSRAVFKNAQGESARRSLAWIAEARQVFATEDSKDEYDIRLRRRPAQVEAARIDWTGRAWNYYHVGDYGAARIAARKAREAAPSDPRPWVVSAWIELAEDNNKQAKAYADEALIADEDKEAVVDVQEVRGVAFESLNYRSKAASCYRQALKYAPDTYKGQLYLRLARVLSSERSYEKSIESIDACLEAYALADNLGSDTREHINQIVRHEITYTHSEELKNLRGKVSARDLPAADRVMLLDIIRSCMRARELMAQEGELNRLADRLRDQPKPSDDDSFLDILGGLSCYSTLGLFIAIFLADISVPSGLLVFFAISTLFSMWFIYRLLQDELRQKAYKRDQERSRITREQASAVKEEALELLERIRNH